MAALTWGMETLATEHCLLPFSMLAVEGLKIRGWGTLEILIKGTDILTTGSLVTENMLGKGIGASAYKCRRGQETVH